jgi:hypothetical protein
MEMQSHAAAIELGFDFEVRLRGIDWPTAFVAAGAAPASTPEPQLSRTVNRFAHWYPFPASGSVVIVHGLQENARRI